MTDAKDGRRAIIFTSISCPTYDPEWAVPKAEYHCAFSRLTRYCVVIPTINEGERIRKQLTRIKQLGLTELVDVIVVDGGSDDGALSFDLLSETGVRALIIKRDSGKLSAQLRIGYAFAMTEGYEGVITIDGNNKDSVESIPLFISALDRGIDYAQGSRYVPGGQAINTPKIRHLAVRFLHVPLVSLAARHWFTDTTNGYRAYSRNYLLHPSVQPFRRIFQTYELLAYLSARASRLGLSVAEIPVTRTYPASGSVPTKISSFRGNFLLLTILGRLLLGQFNPPVWKEILEHAES